MWVGSGIHFHTKNLQKQLSGLALACGNVTLLRQFGGNPNFKMFTALWMEYPFFILQGFPGREETQNIHPSGRIADFTRLFVTLNFRSCFSPTVTREFPQENPVWKLKSNHTSINNLAHDLLGCYWCNQLKLWSTLCPTEVPAGGNCWEAIL